MHHLELAPELAVLVLDRVVAVRARGQNLLEPVLLEDLDVLLGLEQVLVARPARRVAAAALLRAQDGERYARLLQQLRQGRGDLLVAVLEGARAAQVAPVVGLPDLAHEIHAQLLDHPRAALAHGHAPGVGPVLQVLQRRGDLGGRLAQHQGQVAPVVYDLVGVGDRRKLPPSSPRPTCSTS